MSLARRSRIWWGAGYENALDIGYSLRDIICDRIARPGSAKDRSPAGIEDAWITGRDFELRGVARWLPHGPTTDPVASSWSGPLGWQAFLDWCEDGGDFRFVPDATYPDFGIDNCQLVTPALDRRGQQERESDGTYRVPLVIRHPTADLHLAMRGLFFEYEPGASLTDPIVYTFTRATTALRRAVDGAYAQEAAGVLRDRHYVGSRRVALLERVTTNLVENGDFNADAVGANANGGATLARDTAQKVYGAAGLKITTAAAANSGAAFLNRGGSRIAVVAATVYSASLHVYGVGAAIGKSMKIVLEWIDGGGAPLATAELTPFALASGWNRVEFTATSHASAVTVNVYFVTNGDQGVFDCWVDLVQFEENSVATSPIPTNTAAVTRNTDVLSCPHLHRPQVSWWYHRFVELGTKHIGSARYWQVGDLNGIARLLAIRLAPGYRIQHEPVTGGAVVSDAAVTLAIGDELEVLGLLYEDGSVRVSYALNGAAEVVGTRSAASPFAAAWSGPGPQIQFNADTASGNRGNQGLVQFKAGVGVIVNTIALARAA